MENNNYYTSTLDLGISLINESSDSLTIQLYNLAYVRSVQACPSWISNTIFNIICVVGIFTNSVLLIYVIYYKRFKTPVFCVILSLGVADLGVCISSLINYTVIAPYMLAPFWLCNASKALMSLSYLASGYHIVVFAVLRFLQLVYPLVSRAKVTTSLLCKICLAIWAVHSIQAIALSVFYQSVNISPITTSDVYVCVSIGNQHIRYLWFLIVWCLVPFITSGGFHIAKQAIVILSRSATLESQDERILQARRQTDSKALAIVIVMYLVTILPFMTQAIRVYVFNVTVKPVDVYLVEIFSQVGYTNSAINPWIYLFAAESVRSDVRNMLTFSRKMGSERKVNK